MYDSDPFIAALGGRAITPELVEAARRQLLLLQHLAAEVSGAVPGILPSGPGRWRSAAAERYSQGLDELRKWAVGARDALEDAERQLIERLRRMEAQLEVQAAEAARLAATAETADTAAATDASRAATTAPAAHPAPSGESRRILARDNELGALWDDTLTISSGTTTAVATDELFADAARLGSLEAAAIDWLERAGIMSRGLHELDLEEPAARWDTTSPAWSVSVAIQRLRETRNQAGSLHTALLESAERYGATERQIESAWQLGSRIGAWMLGVAAPLLIVPAIGAVAGQSISKGLGLTPPFEMLATASRPLLSDPAFVHFVRVAGGSIDEFVGGLLPGPPGLAPLGELMGAPENASVLLGAAGVAGLLGLNRDRVLLDAPVTATRVDVRPSDNGSLRPPRAEPVIRPPAGVGDLTARIPDASANGAQIRIERYGEPDDARWVVYISGTLDFGLAAGEQAFDQTSNLHGIADDAPLDVMRLGGADSGAGERAVRAAMHEIGVGPGDPLIVVGHSGGGVIAAALAVDPELNAVAALSVGGPVASAPLAEGVPLLSIEHEEDLVPATGGPGHPSPDRITVSRSVLEPGREYEAAVPAHELVRYRETAALIDRSEEERLTAFVDRIAEFTDGGDAETSLWIARREELSRCPPTGER